MDISWRESVNKIEGFLIAHRITTIQFLFFMTLSLSHSLSFGSHEILPTSRYRVLKELEEISIFMFFPPSTFSIIVTSTDNFFFMLAYSWIFIFNSLYVSSTLFDDQNEFFFASSPLFPSHLSLIYIFGFSYYFFFPFFPCG